MPRASRYAVTACGLLLVIFSGCPRANDRPLISRSSRASGRFRTPQVFSRSETRSFTSVASFGGAIYAGTSHGVLRFRADTGEVESITHMEGIPREDGLGLKSVPLGPVHMVTGSVDMGLWLATEELLIRYKDKKWDRFEYHPLLSLPVTSMLTEGDQIWVGSSRNLAIYNGWWHGFLRGSRVNFLLKERVLGGVWVGTDGGGLFRYEGGKFTSHARAKGQLVEKVRCMAYNNSWGVLAVGRGANQEWLAFFDGKYWTSYQVEPRGTLNWVQQFGEQTLLSYGNRILRIQRATPVTRGPRASGVAKPEGPVRLIGQPGPETPSDYPMPHFYTEHTRLWLPPAPTHVVGDGQRTLFSTHTLGVAHYDGKANRWYRTNDLLGDNGRLRMACAATGCYVPGAGGKAYRIEDDAFEQVKVTPEPGAMVQGFFANTYGDLYSLHTPAAGRSLVVSRLAGRSFVELYESPISLPEGSKLEVRFSRLDAAGRLWVGLWHLDQEGKRQHWGAILLPPLPGGTEMGTVPLELPRWAPPEKTDLGPTLIFRTSLLPDEVRPAGSLALPDDIRDIWFRGEESWLATGSGVLLVRGDEVTTFTENEGLASEITYTGLVGPKGIMVGSLDGVGWFNDKEWRFDLADHLNLPSRALLRLGPCLLVGTTKGVVQQCKRGHRFMDESMGLAKNSVNDLYLDNLQRLWVLADGGLSILDGFL